MRERTRKETMELELYDGELQLSQERKSQILDLMSLKGQINQDMQQKELKLKIIKFVIIPCIIFGAIILVIDGKSEYLFGYICVVLIVILYLVLMALLSRVSISRSMKRIFSRNIVYVREGIYRGYTAKIVANKAIMIPKVEYVENGFKRSIKKNGMPLEKLEKGEHIFFLEWKSCLYIMKQDEITWQQVSHIVPPES